MTTLYTQLNQDGKNNDISTLFGMPLQRLASSREIFPKPQRIKLVTEFKTTEKETEIDPPRNIFDGRSNPTTIHVVSTSSNDKDIDTGYIRKIKLYGYDENDEFKSETISLNGVRLVNGSIKWKRIFNFHAVEWGSGGNSAAGVITLASGVITIDYLIINKGKNNSNGARIYIPPGYKGIIGSVDIDMLTYYNTYNSAIVKMWAYNSATGLDPDFPIVIFTTNNRTNGNIDIPTYAFYSSTDDEEGYIKFTQQYTKGSEMINFRIILFMFKYNTE